MLTIPSSGDFFSDSLDFPLLAKFFSMEIYYIYDQGGKSRGKKERKNPEINQKPTGSIISHYTILSMYHSSLPPEYKMRNENMNSMNKLGDSLKTQPRKENIIVNFKNKVKKIMCLILRKVYRGFSPRIIYTYEEYGMAYKPFQYKLLLFSTIELYFLLDT